MKKKKEIVERSCSSSSIVTALIAPYHWTVACGNRYTLYYSYDLTYFVPEIRTSNNGMSPDPLNENEERSVRFAMDYWQNVCAILTMILALFVATSVHAAVPFGEDKVYYTELTCDPKQDVFKMIPVTIKRLEIMNKFDARSVILKRQQFSVFLNGELVGEKVFKDMCKLKKGITVDVDIHYKGMPPTFCGKDVPEKYLPLKKYYPYTCIADEWGNFLIKKQDTLLAAISDILMASNLNFVLINGNLTTNYHIEYIPGSDTKEQTVTRLYTLEQMEKTPLMFKSTPELSYPNHIKE